MSNQQLIKGIITKLVPIKEESLEEQAKRLLNSELNVKWYDTYLEQLLDSNEYILVGENIYQISEQIDLEDYDFCHLEEISFQKFSFITSFYNGGTCLTEVLQEKLLKCGYAQ